MMFDQLISAEKLYMILESAREGLKYSVPPCCVAFDNLQLLWGLIYSCQSFHNSMCWALFRMNYVVR